MKEVEDLIKYKLTIATPIFQTNRIRKMIDLDKNSLTGSKIKRSLSFDLQRNSFSNLKNEKKIQ